MRAQCTCRGFLSSTSIPFYKSASPLAWLIPGSLSAMPPNRLAAPDIAVVDSDGVATAKDVLSSEHFKAQGGRVYR